MIKEIVPPRVTGEFCFLEKVFQQKLQLFQKVNNCQDVIVNILPCLFLLVN